jgi:hypothetical protein
MHTPTRFHPILAATAFVCCVMSGTAIADVMKIMLSGDAEVPPVATMASGSGSITVNPDMTVSGGITTTGLMATAAHIHVGKAGVNGPVAVGLVKQGDNAWRVPDGAKLDAAQFNAYKEGALYVNVHTAANKGGEIRSQLMPMMAGK